MSDLLRELERSADPADVSLAGVLAALRPEPGSLPRPRANEALAAFVAARALGTPAAAGPLSACAEPDLVVVLGTERTARSRAPRGLRRLRPAMSTGRLALAAAAAVAAGAVALAGLHSDQVVVVPADATGPPPATAPAAGIEQEPTPRAQRSPTGAAAQPERSTPQRRAARTGPPAAAPEAAPGSGSDTPALTREDGPGRPAQPRPGAERDQNGPETRAPDGESDDDDSRHDDAEDGDGGADDDGAEGGGPEDDGPDDGADDD